MTRREKRSGAFAQAVLLPRMPILGDPGADSGGKGKSKRAEKYDTKKRKERREEPLGTMSYQTSSKRSTPFCLLIGARKTQVFWLLSHHLCLLAAIGKRFGDASLADVLVESGIVGSGSVAGVIEGRHYNRAVRTHKVHIA